MQWKRKKSSTNKTPFRFVLEHSWSSFTPKKPPDSFNELAAEMLCKQFPVAWLALYRRIDDMASRLAFFDARSQLDLPQTDLPQSGYPIQMHQRDGGLERTLPRTISVKKIHDQRDQPGWVALVPNEVWIYAAVAKPLRDSVRHDERGAHSLGSAIAVAADAGRHRRASRAREVQAQIEHEVLCSTSDPKSNVALFMQIVLSGFSGQRGMVVRIDDQGARETWMTEGDIRDDPQALNIDNFEGNWVASVTAPERLAPGAKSIYAIARRYNTGVVVVVVASASNVDSLSEATTKRVDQAVQLIASVIENEQAIKKFREQGKRLADGIMDLVEIGESAGDGCHHVSVTEMALWIAKVWGIPKRELPDLERACRVHDVGRVGVATDPAGTASEFLHPQLGASLLEAFGESPRVVTIVRSHHERYDQLGFPLGKPPRVEDRAAWALIAAESIVERAERRNEDPSNALRAWINDEGSRVLPPQLFRSLDGFIANTSTLK